MRSKGRTEVDFVTSPEGAANVLRTPLPLDGALLTAGRGSAGPAPAPAPAPAFLFAHPELAAFTTCGARTAECFAPKEDAAEAAAGLIPASRKAAPVTAVFLSAAFAIEGPAAWERVAARSWRDWGGAMAVGRVRGGGARAVGAACDEEEEEEDEGGR